MAKGNKAELSKDAVAKLYLQNPELVADLFNAFTFNVEHRVSADTLSPFPTEEIATKLDDRGMEMTGQLQRDVSYIAYTDGNAMYFLCIEVQSKTDWTMPLRVMRYDAAKYQYQIETHSGKTRTRLFPVFTLVLNLGKGPWRGPRSLLEMMDGVDEGIKDAVSDYRINIADPYMMSEKTLNALCTEIKDVLIYFRASRDKEGFMRFMEENADVSLSERAIMLLNTYLNMKLEPQNNDGRKTKMCVAWRYFKQQAINEGRSLGREENKKNVAVEALRINLDYDTIQKLTGFSIEEIKMIAASVKA